MWQRQERHAIVRYDLGPGSGVAFVNKMHTGDQGFVEKCRGGIYAKTSETSPTERLSPFRPIPQEFHSEKVCTYVKLDGVGPVDNRPSIDKLNHFVKKKKKDHQRMMVDLML